MSQIWAFAVFAAVLTVTPGLDTMLVLRTTAVAGRRAGLASALGIGLGCLVWAVAGALGVTAVLSASRVAFEVLRIAGVVYLCWLGARALWKARPRTARPPTASPVGRSAASPSGLPPAVSTGAFAASSGATSAAVPAGPSAASLSGAAAGPELSAIRALRIGVVTNLLNPKVGVFYLSVMPQFLPTGANPLAGSLALGGIHIVEGLVWLSLVVLAVNRARGWLTRPTVKRRMEQLTGLAFIGFGLRLAVTPDPH
jgi:threonine/homoserine/homoserine lactone efflux protein